MAERIRQHHLADRAALRHGTSRLFTRCVTERWNKLCTTHPTNLRSRTSSCCTCRMTESSSNLCFANSTNLRRRTSRRRAGSVTERINDFLFDKNDRANRAMLTFGKTRRGTGRHYGSINHFNVAERRHKISITNITNLRSRTSRRRTGSMTERLAVFHRSLFRRTAKHAGDIVFIDRTCRTCCRRYECVFPVFRSHKHMPIYVICIICNVSVSSTTLRNVERRTVIDRLEATAIFERITANARHATRNRDAREATALGECIIANARHTFRNCDAREATAIFERITANARHTIWNRDARKATAIFERPFADARHTVGNRNAREATATTERRITDACHSIRNCDVREATATEERTIADARHTAISRNYTILTSCN